MRGILIAVMLAGCSFKGSSAAPDGASSVPVDAASPVTGDAAADAMAVAHVVPCSGPNLAGLVACYEFEDAFTDGMLADSSPNHLDASTSGLTASLRGSSHAATVGASSMTYAPQIAAFDRAGGYTTTMWVAPSSLPTEGGVYGLLDHELQYATAIITSGGIAENRCIHTGGTTYELTANLPTDQWSLLACSWDGTNLCAMRWSSASDHERNCYQPGLPPAAAGAHGLAIGHLSTGGVPHDRFDGAVDSIHVFDHALTSDQVCAAIGQATGCLPCDQCN